MKRNTGANRRLGDIEGALEAYRQQRILRTARVQLLSRVIGDHIYHPAGVHASLRNAIMGAKSNDEWYNIMAWVYDGPSTDLRLRS